MRILMMTDTPPDPDSGAAGTEYRTVEALRLQGHDVDALWSPDLPRRIAHGNLHYLLELPRVYRTAMERRLAAKPYDVVHTSQPHGWLAARELRRRGSPAVFVHRSHGFEPRIAANIAAWKECIPPRPLLRRLASRLMTACLETNNRGIAKYAHGHIVSSSLCASWLRDHYGVPGERIAVLPQAAPDSFREPPAGPMEEARLDKLLYVGQFAPVKAPKVLASAFEIVLRTRPGATLTWVCSVSHHEAVQNLFDPESMKRISLLGWMPQEELIRVYDAHGVFLFPSYAEGFGKAMVEALSRGLLVIASDQGGAHDLIEDGTNGLRVPVGSAEALAQAYLRARGDARRCITMAAKGHETASALSWARVARDAAAFYMRLREMP